MPFSASIREKARKKAHYRCVICHEPFVDVHHIKRESEGGPNTLENAAALCSGCHDTYGNNPDKRKQIKGMRDLWYDLCKSRYAQSDIASFKKLDELYEMTKSVKEDHYKILEEIKATVAGTVTSNVASIQAAQTFQEVSSISGYLTSGTRLSQNVYADVNCRNCGTRIGLLVGTNKCPNCGKPIS